MSETDRIERSIVINAPRERVWRALANAEEFGAWFGVDLSGQSFRVGQRARAKMNLPDHPDCYFDATFERIEPTGLMSFRWIPYVIDPAADPENEEPTLVTFTLHDAAGSATLLKVVESGFDRVPAHRRARAFEMNGRGWEAQLRRIAKYAGE